MPGTLHIVGAGLAGLACAVKAVNANQNVIVYEATKRAGGRCRSFFDSGLQRTLDNGSHVVLAGNPAVFEYLSRIGAEDQLYSPSRDTGIPFANLTTDEHWTIKTGRSSFPWFLFRPSARPPATTLGDFLKAMRLFTSSKNATVESVLSGTGHGWATFWAPFAESVLNTAPHEASARLLAGSLKRGLLSANGGLHVYLPSMSLDRTFVEPALAFLQQRGVQFKFECPLVAVSGEDRLTRLRFRGYECPMASHDRVVIALPPWAPVLKSVVKSTPQFKPSPIVNVHYEQALRTTKDLSPITGVIGGTAHWIFVQDGVISVTVSAAADLAAQTKQEIADVLWRDVCRSFGWPDALPPAHRVVVERRATPVQDATFVRSRPDGKTRYANAVLAGDWIDTGLPCTLESAVLSGFRAAVSIRPHS